MLGAQLNTPQTRQQKRVYRHGTEVQSGLPRRAGVRGKRYRVNQRGECIGHKFESKTQCSKRGSDSGPPSRGARGCGVWGLRPLPLPAGRLRPWGLPARRSVRDALHVDLLRHGVHAHLHQWKPAEEQALAGGGQSRATCRPERCQRRQLSQALLITRSGANMPAIHTIHDFRRATPGYNPFPAVAERRLHALTGVALPWRGMALIRLSLAANHCRAARRGRQQGQARRRHGRACHTRKFKSSRIRQNLGPGGRRLPPLCCCAAHLVVQGAAQGPDAALNVVQAGAHRSLQGAGGGAGRVCDAGVGRGAARNTRGQRGSSSPCSWLRLVRARGRPTHHGADHGHDLGEGCHLQGTGQRSGGAGAAA